MFLLLALNIKNPAVNQQVILYAPRVLSFLFFKICFFKNNCVVLRAGEKA